MLDLAALKGRDRIKNWEDPNNWNFPDLNELWSGMESAHAGSAA
jgi:hypothetical protein